VFLALTGAAHPDRQWDLRHQQWAGMHRHGPEYRAVRCIGSCLEAKRDLLELFKPGHVLGRRIEHDALDLEDDPQCGAP
jgi:hypothetical protein